MQKADLTEKVESYKKSGKFKKCKIFWKHM